MATNEKGVVKRNTLPFEKTMMQWFKANGNRLGTFAGGEENARRLMAGLFYSASRVPKLMECSVVSLGDCLMQSAQLKLYPGAMQECAYLPFKNVATFVPMYQGLLKLCYNSGHMESVQAAVVYEKDDFDYMLGDKPYLRHKPHEGPDEKRGDRTYVYSVIHLSRGLPIIRVKNIEWVKRRQNQSKAGKSEYSPWNTDEDTFDEMAIKTILKYGLKLVPKSADLAEAISLDDAAERPEFVKPKIVDLEVPEGEEPSATDPTADSGNTKPPKPQDSAPNA